MTSFDAAISKLLLKRIEEEIELHTTSIMQGAAKDFADYKARSSAVQMLQTVKTWIEDAEFDLKS